LKFHEVNFAYSQRPRIGDGRIFNERLAQTSADKRTKSTEYEQKSTIVFSAGTEASKRTKSSDSYSSALLLPMRL
jgi:hypothetical protein